ncbi:hypothetical protein BK726_02130 [Bacillus thuringiensis serovar londrina]|uniref:hypothetical protein n=1 Tax=Bacillus thuringiensis TaxID=1428 RepID=UPI000B455035|nr:hypothetical protein [Bacillus thuringiensis]OTX80736.1 hypothetical protein BK726_27865 [Bacillus thuringiensis serovar londrina]OTX87114.1 hypothetical protein BK726_17275 [Bacillus thuringiensis serovar londrina]OTX95062.1 hypothetical protein BK726_02325 [Bacillus thuringiensis serovar londrina]OTX95264.1 hypothetical protein BK726_02130 [Bacillus thuringiensis serovar londrina]
MDFERIPILLKRYDFKSKMNICQQYSREIMSINGLVSSQKLIDNVLPWELETFALFSTITFKEYSNRNFEDPKEQKNFIKIINTIKNYIPPILEDSKNNNKFLDNFLIVTGLNQLQIQENIRYKLYRYSYIFNFENENVNMKQEFFNKFGCYYTEFKKIGFIIHCLCTKELNGFLSPNIQDYVFKSYHHVIKHLLIERENYILLQEQITKDITHYIYGFKYFYQFPFISYDQEIFLPLPHLIMQSVTSSLLFRLTEGNNMLRQLFGKEVLESYILHVCGLSNHFDEVTAEYAYKYKRNNKRTLDIMIQKENQCLMLDSKSMSPRASLRNLDEHDVEHTIDRIVESVIQVYKHITERFQNEYYPFSGSIEFSKENIFGAVILFEDSYIRRDVIINKVAEKLGIDFKSKDYKYLCSNVKLISLYELEKMIFEKENVFQLLTDNSRNEKKWFDLTLIDYSKNECNGIIDHISQTVTSMREILNNFAEELVEEGLITKG